jgi:hypothetical protein
VHAERAPVQRSPMNNSSPTAAFVSMRAPLARSIALRPSSARKRAAAGPAGPPADDQRVNGTARLVPEGC